MEKLQETLNEVFVEFEQSGKIKEMFEQKIAACISDVVESEFRYNGNGRKAIEAAIEKALPGNIEATLDILEYNHAVSAILKEKLGGLFTEESKRMADNLVDDLLKAPAKEVTLDELAKAFVEQCTEEAHEHGWDAPHIELEEKDWSWSTPEEDYNITFRPHDTDYSYRDKVELFVSGGQVLIVRFGDEEKFAGKFSARNAQVHEFEKLVFQLYACRIKLVRGEFDEGDYYYPDRY